jgi:hypothetical protein
MKKSEVYLFKLASKFQNKYAQSQTLQEIIGNAAGYGEKSANGIMNFPAQLKKDQADLSINITVDTAMLGGYNVTVDPPTVDPPQYAQNYARLPDQIKNYLNRHISNFPQVPIGTTTLRFSGKTSEPGIAAQ